MGEVLNTAMSVCLGLAICSVGAGVFTLGIALIVRAFNG